MFAPLHWSWHTYNLIIFLVKTVRRHCGQKFTSDNCWSFWFLRLNSEWIFFPKVWCLAFLIINNTHIREFYLQELCTRGGLVRALNSSCRWNSRLDLDSKHDTFLEQSPGVVSPLWSFFLECKENSNSLVYNIHMVWARCNPTAVFTNMDALTNANYNIKTL